VQWAFIEAGGRCVRGGPSRDRIIIISTAVIFVEVVFFFVRDIFLILSSFFKGIFPRLPVKRRSPPRPEPRIQLMCIEICVPKIVTPFLIYLRRLILVPTRNATDNITRESLQDGCCTTRRDYGCAESFE
jgi:hypothetical protein